MEVRGLQKAGLSQVSNFNVLEKNDRHLIR
jgi:hypothetical protein